MKATVILLIMLLSHAFTYSSELKNAIGWDRGISYRRSINDKLFIGVTLGGDLHKSFRNEKEDQTGKYVNLDSSYAFKSTGKDENYDYSIRPSVMCGYNIFKYKKIGFDLFGRIQYDYDWGEEKDSSRYNRGYTNYYHTITGSAGISPNITLMERFLLEYHLGISGTYERGKRSDYSKYDDSQYHIYDEERDYTYRRYYFNFIGRDFSLNMRFIAHFMF